MFTTDMAEGMQPPKRGDLFHTNVNTGKERTWFVLRVIPVKSRVHPRRVKVWAVRWWEIDPPFRMALFRCAERAGGQQVIYFVRYPPKRKPTFEQLMRGQR